MTQLTDEMKKRRAELDVAMGVGLFCETDIIPVFSAEEYKGEIKILIYYNPFFTDVKQLREELVDSILHEWDRILTIGDEEIEERQEEIDSNYEEQQLYLQIIDSLVVFMPLGHSLLFEETNSKYHDLSDRASLSDLCLIWQTEKEDEQNEKIKNI